MKKFSAIVLAVIIVLITAVSSVCLGIFISGQSDVFDLFTGGVVEQNEQQEDQQNNTSEDTDEIEFNDDLTHHEDGVKIDESQLFDSSEIAYLEHHLYGIKFLGYGDERDMSYQNLDLIDVTGDEYYLIVPRFDNQKVKISMINYQDFSNMDNPNTQTVFTSFDGEPFVLKCNVSDIYSNVFVDISNQQGNTIFSPRISLEDGSLMVDNFGCEIK